MLSIENDMHSFYTSFTDHTKKIGCIAQREKQTMEFLNWFEQKNHY